jgi:nitrate reductase gamma subunit
VLSVMSFGFHLGVVLVPPLLAEHVVRWEGLLGVGLPTLAPVVAEVLTVATIVCGVGLLLYRAVIPRARALSTAGDFGLLLLVLAPFASGFLAAHPRLDPLPWQAMLLVHALSADLLFLVVPFTKLAHVVLIPFDRLSAVHWQLQPGSGERVASALYGEEVRV